MTQNESGAVTGAVTTFSMPVRYSLSASSRLTVVAEAFRRIPRDAAVVHILFHGTLDKCLLQRSFNEGRTYACLARDDVSGVYMIEGAPRRVYFFALFDLKAARRAEPADVLVVFDAQKMQVGDFRRRLPYMKPNSVTYLISASD